MKAMYSVQYYELRVVKQLYLLSDHNRKMRRKSLTTRNVDHDFNQQNMDFLLKTCQLLGTLTQDARIKRHSLQNASDLSWE